jgi:YHS domain-containing protein
MPNMDQAEGGAMADPLGPDPMGGAQRAADGDQMAVDPVCGTRVDKRTARFTANYLGQARGWDTFYFCCEECKQLFEADPEQYVKGL